MNLRRTIATLLAALMLLALTACGAGTTPPAQDANTPAEEADPPATESSQFRVGMECAYAPSNWQESAATDTNVPVENVAGAYAEGYDVQIARILADQLGKELVIVKLSWDGLIDALNQGQIDAIIAGMMDTAERRESINFSDPYKETIYSMMVLAGSPYENATSIQDFSGAAVLGQQGTALDDVIDQIEGPGLPRLESRFPSHHLQRGQRLHAARQGLLRGPAQVRHQAARAGQRDPCHHRQRRAHRDVEHRRRQPAEVTGGSTPHKEEAP